MKRCILDTSIPDGPESIATTASRRRALLFLSASVVLCGAMSVFGVRAYTSKTPNNSPAPSSTIRSPSTANNPLAISSAAPAIRDSLNGSEASENNYPPSGHFAPQAAAKPRLTDSVLITIAPGGFDTAQITAPAVPFFLLVENRSGLDEVSLLLDRIAGARLRQATVPQEQLDWSDLLDLSPGEYVLSEASHPNWICRITITSK